MENHRGFNQTILELKYGRSFKAPYWAGSFNQTILELKLIEWCRF